MLVASAISLRPDIRGLRSIGVQRKLPWHRTSHDDHGTRAAVRAYYPLSDWSLSTSGVDGAH